MALLQAGKPGAKAQHPPQQLITPLQDRGTWVRVVHAGQIKPAPHQYPSTWGVPPATSPARAVPISVSRRPGGGGFLRWSSMCRVISSREAVE